MHQTIKCTLLTQLQRYRLQFCRCNVGPTVWCQSEQNAAVCGVADDVVGICGFSVENCPVQTVKDFCTTNPNASSFMGGLSGARAGFYGYAVLALCVPSTKCGNRWTQALLQFPCTLP